MRESGEPDDQLGGGGGFAGANRPNWKRFLPRMLSLETIPQINSSVRACVRPWLESVKVLVLIISPVWVSKLPGMLGPL